MRLPMIVLLAAALGGAAAPACADTGGNWSAQHAAPGFFSDSHSVVPPAGGGLLDLRFDDCHDVELHAVTVDGRSVALSPDGRFTVAALLPGAAALVVTVTGLAAATPPGRGPARYALTWSVNGERPELLADLRPPSSP